MAAKKPASKKPDLSPRKKNAEEYLQGKTQFKSQQRVMRDKATQKEKARAIKIIERAEKMKLAKDLYAGRWPEYEKTWKMVEDERSEEDKWRANLPDTFAYASVKTAQAAYLDSEVVPIFSKNQDDDLMRSNDLRDLYTDISKKGSLKFQCYLARLDAFKLGTGFLFTYFEKDTRVVWDIDSFDPDTEKITYKKVVRDRFSDPKSVRVSPYLVLVDEMATADFRGSASDAILIEILSRDAAKLKYGHLFGGGDNFDKRVPTSSALLQQYTQGASQGIATTAADNKRDVSVREFRFFTPTDLADDTVEVLHYFCVRPEDSYEVLINREPAMVSTDSAPSPMPYIHKEIPLTPIRYALYGGDEFWGQGIIEVTRADAKAMREHREMMSDRQRLSLFSPAFSDVTDEIDQKLLKIKPLSIIRTRGGVPQQWRIPGITAADLQITENYTSSIRRATGIDEHMIGGGTQELAQHRYTATAIQFMRQAAFLRLKDFQFLYKMAMIEEIQLKTKLFEQYYASPLKRVSHLKDQPGLEALAGQAKRFKVKVGNLYTQKDVSSTLFTGAIEDVDVDMQSLVPMTPAELVTKWSQAIRDTVPFIQAGIVSLDLDKMLQEYLGAMEINIDKFRMSPDDEAISMADGEHALLAASASSQPVYDNLLKDPTPPQFLNAAHLKRHQQLLQSDEEIGAAELRNIIAHIKADTDAYQKLMEEQAAKAGANVDKLDGKLGDFGAPNNGRDGGPKPPSVSMSYKDAPDDVKRQIEEAAGFSGSQTPGVNANEKKKLDTSRVGKEALGGADGVVG